MNLQQHRWKWIALGAAAVLVTAAAGAKSITPLEGRWASTCFTTSSGARITPMVFAVLVDGNSMTFEKRSYGDSGCKTLMGVESMRGSFSMQPSLGAASALPVDFTVERFTLSVLSPVLAVQYNSAAFCGFNDWQENQPKDITGRNCQGTRIPEAGTVFFELMGIEDGLFHRGHAAPGRDGTSSVSRPIELNYDLPFHAEK